MAEKNWLIRTKNKQILGPATKQKIIELIQNGSLTSEDEITSGNGYWFWIKEDDLLEKYIFGEEPQMFNPISEAEDVLTAGGRNLSIEPFLPSERPVAAKTSLKSVEKPVETLFPKDEDLEYPDLSELVSLQEEDDGEAEIDDLAEDNLELSGETDPDLDIKNTEIEDDGGALDLTDLSDQIAEMKAEGRGQLNDFQRDSDNGEENLPSREDLEYPDMDFTDDLAGESNQKLPPRSVPELAVEHNKTAEISLEVAAPSVPKTISKRKSKPFSVEENEGETIWDELEKNEGPTVEEKTGKQRNDKYLFFILILVFFLIATLFYYYKMVLNKPLPLVGISEAHAQSISSLPMSMSKKKSFLLFRV